MSPTFPDLREFFQLLHGGQMLGTQGRISIFVWILTPRLQPGELRKVNTLLLFWSATGLGRTLVGKAKMRPRPARSRKGMR